MTNDGKVQCISVRQMTKVLKNHRVVDGSVLLLKHQTPTANDVAIKTIVEALEGMRVKALVVVVESFDDLTVLNELEMNKHGWFRLKTVSRLRGAPKPKEEDKDG